MADLSCCLARDNAPLRAEKNYTKMLHKGNTKRADAEMVHTRFRT